MASISFAYGTQAGYDAISTPTSGKIYFVYDTPAIYLNGTKYTFNENETAGAITAAINDLDTVSDVTLATKDAMTDIITLKTGIKEVDGIVQALTDTIDLAKVAATGMAEDVEIVDGNGYFNADNVENALAELAGLIASYHAASGAVTCEVDNDPANASILKTYSFYQSLDVNDTPAQKEAKKIVDINLPKDYLIKNVTVETCVTANTPLTGLVVGDKYIDFTVNVKTDTTTSTVSDTHIYIAVKDFVHTYTTESNAAEIQLTINSNDEISAEAVDIAASKITYVEADATAVPPVARKSVADALDDLAATLVWETIPNPAGGGSGSGT